MARITPSPAWVGAIHGDFKRHKRGDVAIVGREVYGNNYANYMKIPDVEPTAAQIAGRARFAEAASKAAADMADPEKKAEWQAVADSSGGKFKTARGAAFASYYNASSPAE